MADIHADMTIDEVLEAKPHAKDLLFEYGLFSEREAVRSMETIREAADAHGLSEDKVEALINTLKNL